MDTNDIDKAFALLKTGHTVKETEPIADPTSDVWKDAMKMIVERLLECILEDINRHGTFTPAITKDNISQRGIKFCEQSLPIQPGGIYSTKVYLATYNGRRITKQYYIESSSVPNTAIHLKHIDELAQYDKLTPMDMPEPQF